MNHPANGDHDLLPLKDYIEDLGFNLDKREYNYVANIIAAAYKFTHGEEPDTISFTYVTENGKKARTKVYGYGEKDFVMIYEMMNALRDLQMSLNPDFNP